MIKATLVVGGSARDREVAINNLINQRVKNGVLLEGLPDGNSVLLPSGNMLVTRIAPGCICCDNNMVMRVYLNRLIQQHPHQLFLGLSNHLHLPKIKAFLSTPSYLKVLEFGSEINLELIKSSSL